MSGEVEKITLDESSEEEQMLREALADRYKVIRKLGAGGMASVYLAHEIDLDRKIAIKLLPREFLRDNEFTVRFKREAQIAANLEHPNIVRIYQISEEDEVAVFRVDIADDVIADLNWVDWDQIASFTGQEVEDIHTVAKGPNVIGRAQIYEAVAGYHGWREFDDSPELLTVEEAEAKYDDDIEKAHKARKANPCKKGEILIDRRGYARKGYRRKDGTHVKSTRVPRDSFCIDDPGSKGRRARGAEKGPFRKEAPWIEDTGSLGGPGYTKKPVKTRHQILNRCVKNEDYR